MKYFFICTVAILLSSTSYGQTDSSSTLPNRWLHLHVANGVNFIRNEALQNSYATKAIHFWSLGVRLSNPQKSKVFVNVDYNFSNYRLTTEVNRVRQDSLLKLNQLIPSLSVELLKLKNGAIRTKAGYIFAFLKDDINKLDEASFGFSSGFKFGLSIENMLSKSQAVHFDLDYDLMKAKNKAFGDYDVWKLSFGFYL